MFYIELSAWLYMEPTLLDGLQIPKILPKSEPPVQTGVEDSVFKKFLVDSCGTMAVPAYGADELKARIATWSAVMQDEWNRKADVYHYDFNPLYNYDRHEVYTDTRTHTDTSTGSTTSGAKINSSTSTDTSTTTSASTRAEATESGTTTGATTNLEQVSAYNAADFQNSGKTTGNSDGTSASNSTHTGTGTENGTGKTTTAGSGDSTGSETRNDKRQISETVGHDAHLYGNIGVTTTTQMLSEVWEFAKHNIWMDIVDDFKNRFCLLVYC